MIVDDTFSGLQIYKTEEQILNFLTSVHMQYRRYVQWCVLNGDTYNTYDTYTYTFTYDAYTYAYNTHTYNTCTYNTTFNIIKIFAVE